jgi:hypothetical protein
MDTINIKNNRRFLAVIAIILLFSLFSNALYYTGGKDILAQSTSREGSVVYANEFEDTEQINVEKIDVSENRLSKEEIAFNKKVSNIESYFIKRDAPLAKYAEEFVKAAEHYNIDYRLVAAISIIESSGGKHTFKPYNAWGWGKSGFESWKDGIWSVSEGLAKYYASGRTTPQSIAPSYCPPSADAWARKVSYVMNVISNQ